MARQQQREATNASMRDRVRQRLNEQESEGGAWAVDIPQGSALQLKENQKGGICIKRLDFLPYITSNSNEVENGTIWFRRTYGVHRGIGVEAKTRLCLAKTFKQPCPVDPYQAKMYKAATTEEEKKAAKEIYCKDRELYNVVDLDDEDKGVQVFDISYHLFGKKLRTELDMAPDFKYDGFADLAGGFTLICRFKKKTFGETEYFEIDRIDFEPRGDYPEKETLEATFDLDSLLKPLTFEQLEKELYGDNVEAAEPVAEEAPRRGVGLRRNAAPAAEQEEKEPEKAEPAPEPEKKAPLTRGGKAAPAPPKEETKKEPFPTGGRQPRKDATESGGDTCLYGHKFAFDTDAFTECVQKCQEAGVYDKCADAYDARVKSGGK